MVFIVSNQNVAILEIGFGATGLNAFITFLSLKKLQQSIEYVEAYPISVDEVLSMNYVSELNANQERLFFDICTLVIGKKLSLSTDFTT
jgi:hypothetical protein